MRGRLSFDGRTVGREGPARGGGDGVERRKGWVIASGDRVSERIPVSALGVLSVVDTIDSSPDMDIFLEMSAA